MIYNISLSYGNLNYVPYQQPSIRMPGLKPPICCILPLSENQDPTSLKVVQCTPELDVAVSVHRDLEQPSADSKRPLCWVAVMELE